MRSRTLHPPTIPMGGYGGYSPAGAVGGAIYPTGFDPTMSYDDDPVRANQMMASAAPVDLNAIASPDWQRYAHVLKQRGATMGGSYKNFRPDFANAQAEDAYAGLLAATGQQFHGFGKETTPLNALRKVR